MAEMRSPYKAIYSKCQRLPGTEKHKYTHPLDTVLTLDHFNKLR